MEVTVTEVPNSVPDTFTFTDVTNVERWSEQQANITVSGINIPATISIDNGMYTLDDGTTWTSLSLKESAYVGLIINELVTNAYKHAFEEGKGIISIHFHKKGEVFTLIVEDNGRGFAPDPKSQSLGLKLIYTLVYDQLEGTITLLSDKRTKYTIRFRGE